MTGELVPRTNSSHITKKDSKESTLFTAFSNYFDRAGTPATLYLTWLYEDSMSPYLDFSFPISSSCQGKQNKIRRTSTDSRESDTTDHSRNKKKIRWISLGEIQGIKSDHTLSKCKSIRGAGMAQWWERSPPTNVARVRFPDPASYVGCVCAGSRPCSEGFSPGTPVFLPQQKPTRGLFELAVGCAPRSCMDRTAAASGAYICFRSDLVELRPCCTLRGRLARQLLLLFSRPQIRWK